MIPLTTPAKYVNSLIEKNREDSGTFEISRFQMFLSYKNFCIEDKTQPVSMPELAQILTTESFVTQSCVVRISTSEPKIVDSVLLSNWVIAYKKQIPDRARNDDDSEESESPLDSRSIQSAKAVFS